MNILNLLTEAPKDELALQQVSRAIADYIIGRVEQGDFSTRNDVSYLLFKLSDLPKGSASHLSTAMRHTDVFVKLVSPRSEHQFDGAYHVGLNSMELTVMARLNDDGTYSITDKQALYSTIVHELRHRLDDARSGRKAFNYNEEYIKRPHEINARFSQAVADMVAELKRSFDSGKVLSSHEFVALFEKYADQYDLMKVFQYNPDSVTDYFVQFMEKGIFGRKMDMDNTRKIAATMAPSGTSQHVGPMGDKAYRRLISRLVLIYNAAVERWTKAKK